jgi:hypothetical protein
VGDGRPSPSGLRVVVNGRLRSARSTDESGRVGSSRRTAARRRKRRTISSTLPRSYRSEAYSMLPSSRCPASEGSVSEKSKDRSNLAPLPPASIVVASKAEIALSAAAGRSA